MWIYNSTVGTGQKREADIQDHDTQYDEKYLKQVKLSDHAAT